MLTDQNKETNESRCMSAAGFGKNLAFFMLGGGIGAALALIFAPMPGKELRRDIKDAASRRYDEAVEAAQRVHEQAVEVYDAAKEKGIQVLDDAGEKVMDVKDEITSDAAMIGEMAEGAARRVVETVRSKKIF